MSAVTLGDLLDAAGRHLDAAGRARGVARDAAGGTRQLYRLVTGMTRYLYCTFGEVTEAMIGPGPGSWETGAAGLLGALRLAADRIHAAARYLDEPDPVPSDPHTGELAGAAAAVAAGADLLQTHASTSPDGDYTGRSPHAQLLTCQPVVMAVTEQVARWAGQAASRAAWLANAGTAPRAARAELAAASAWLWAGEGCAQHAAAEPGALTRQELLRGFPLATPPERIPPRGGESDPGLHAGITISADRLRAIAFTAPRQARWSPGAASPAWQRTARAAAIVCDLAELTVRLLAGRCGQLAGPPVSPGQLGTAASCLRDARSAWEQAAGLWRYMSTDTSTEVSRATTEAADLVVRMGRVVFENPQWTPAITQRAPLREAASLAPDRAGFAAALSAVHHACDAVACIADADQAAIRGAYAAGRLFISNRVLEDNRYPPRSFLTAPADRALFLQRAYQVAIMASADAVSALDGLAIQAGTQSRILAVRRAALTSAGGPPAPDSTVNAEAIAQGMRHFTRPRHSRQRRRAEIDAAAVIRAYEDGGQTLQQCADHHMTTVETIKAILAEHGVRPRPPRARQRPGSARNPAGDPGTPATAAPALPGGWAPNGGPVQTALTEAGTSDPSLLVRAAAIDKAAAALIAQAAGQHPASSNAARLAASSFPHAGPIPSGSADAAAAERPELAARRARERTHPARGLF